MIDKLLKIVSGNLPLLLVMAFFLLIMLVVFGQTKIPSTFREYAVSDKHFNTPSLVTTVLATSYGGGMIVGNVENIHRYGLPFICFLLFSSIFSFCFISWLALRMLPFMYNLSMSESIGRVYGKYPRIITSIANICFCIVAIAIQINIMSFAIGSCIGGINQNIITYLVVATLVFYATIGGIRIITFMDVIQFFAFFFMLPVLFFWIPKKTGIRPSDMLYELVTTQERFQFKSLFQAWHANPMMWISGLLSNLVININPPVMQRIYMSHDRFQASRVFLIVGGYGVVIMLCIVLVGLMAAAAMPQIAETEVWPYLMTDIPPIVHGFVVIGLLAISMSTADSFLNSASVMFSNDVMQSFMPKKSILFSKQLRFAKCTAFLIGIAAIVLSFCCNNLSELYMLARACFIPIVTVPFILAVLGFRAKSHTVLIGMVVGLLAIFSWNKLVEPTTHINGSLPSMIANGLAMMAAHYLLPKSKNKTKEEKVNNSCV